MDIEKYNRYFDLTDKLNEIWDKCIFVFDTSALLNFYSYSEKSKKEIFKEVFSILKNRLWMPKQVEFEFLKHRSSVLKSPIKDKYEDLINSHLKPVEDSIKTIQEHLDNIKNKTKKPLKHPYIDSDLISTMETEFLSYKSTLNSQIERFHEEIEKCKEDILKLEKDDLVLKTVSSSFEIGDDYNYEYLLKIVNEGEFRYKQNIPPGYMD